MAKTITATEKFLVQDQEVEATYSVDDLRGNDAFDAGFECVSIEVNGEPVSEDDFGWMADNIREQVLVHQFCKASKNFEMGCGHDHFLSMQ